MPLFFIEILGRAAKRGHKESPSGRGSNRGLHPPPKSSKCAASTLISALVLAEKPATLLFWVKLESRLCAHLVIPFESPCRRRLEDHVGDQKVLCNKNFCSFF